MSKICWQDVGQRIRALRTARGLTGQRLAELADISAGYLSDVEHGKSEISGEKLLRLAKALGTTIQHLLEGTDESKDSEVRIPSALSRAAEELKLSHAATIRLLKGKMSLMARRSQSHEKEWEVNDWVSFYSTVKDYLPQD